MTRAQAELLIDGILNHKVRLIRTAQARERMYRRGYEMDDVQEILWSHAMDLAPEWDDKHMNHKVSLSGVSVNGRPTRVILGLSLDEPCKLVTIMTLHPPRQTTGKSR